MTIAPANEVIITIQFKSAARQLNPLEIARLYEVFSPKFPLFEQGPAAGPMPFKLTQLDGSEPIEYTAGMTRLRFVNETRTRVIMFQADRFSYGWQRTVGLDQQDDYPGFDALLSEAIKEWERLRAWFSSSLEVTLEPRIAEVAYVNAFVTRTPDGDLIRLSQIYNFLNPSIQPASINGYSHTWNQRLRGVDGVMVISAEGPVITPEQIPATLFSITSTFELSSEEQLQTELLLVREQVGETFRRVINEERRP